MASMNPPVLYLMLGYPGAGKTTVAKFVQQLTGAERLTSDQVRLELFSQPKFTAVEHQALYGALDQRTEALLNAGKSVIYDANLNRYQYRQEKYDICARIGAKPVLLWLNTPRVIAKERALRINRQHLVPASETPETMFERIASLIEPPQANEQPLVIDGSEIGQANIKELLRHAGLY